MRNQINVVERSPRCRYKLEIAIFYCCVIWEQANYINVPSTFFRNRTENPRFKLTGIFLNFVSKIIVSYHVLSSSDSICCSLANPI